MARPLVVNVATLLRDPGARSIVRTVVDAGEIDIVDTRIEPGSAVEVDILLDSMSDGIVATGEATVAWRDHCRRCVRDVGGVVRAPLRELFQQHVSTDDAAPVIGEQIDLSHVVRDVILLELPVAALCRDDCAGLCPTCGADRNEARCGCDAAVTDERWSALDQLRDRLG